MVKASKSSEGIFIYGCALCDSTPARHDTPNAQGKAFVQSLRKAFKGMPHIHVKSTACLGGCEHLPPGSKAKNGCCSVGISGLGRYSYVLNLLNPITDLPKVQELVRLYLKHPKGLIKASSSPLAESIRPHIATRVPPQG